MLPVIMVTSSIGQEKTKAIEAGADDFIPKPFNHDELLARVRSLLRHRLESSSIASGSTESGSARWAAPTTSRSGRRARGSESLVEIAPSFEVDLTACEGVDAPPPTGDVEQRQHSYAGRERRVDYESIADRLEAEHRSQEEQRRSSRPGLRAAGGRVLHRVLGRSAVVARKRFGSRPSKNTAASRIPAAICAASSLNPYRRRPHAMNELSNGHTVPTW